MMHIDFYSGDFDRGLRRHSLGRHGPLCFFQGQFQFPGTKFSKAKT